MDILKKDWNVKKTKNNRGKDILDDDYDSSRSVPLGGGDRNEPTLPLLSSFLSDLTARMRQLTLATTAWLNHALKSEGIAHQFSSHDEKFTYLFPLCRSAPVDIFFEKQSSRTARITHLVYHSRQQH